MINAKIAKDRQDAQLRTRVWQTRINFNLSVCFIFFRSFSKIEEITDKNPIIRCVEWIFFYSFFTHYGKYSGKRFSIRYGKVDKSPFYPVTESRVLLWLPSHDDSAKQFFRWMIIVLLKKNNLKSRFLSIFFYASSSELKTK